MRWYLGIDGGGTRTSAFVVREDGVVGGEGQAGPANYHNLGLRVAVENLVSASRAALEKAGLSSSSVERAWVGCAGLKSRRDYSTLRSGCEVAGLAPVGAVEVANDLYNALAGGLSGRPGIALIAGTGCNCLGRDASGRSFMCGGWGWLLDGPGSALGLVLHALQACVRAADRRERDTRLLPSLLAFLGLREADELLARLYVDKWSPDELAQFAPVLLRLAAEGDEAAARVMNAGAESLAELVATTADQLEFSEPPEVVILGGCARSGYPYQPAVEAAIRRALPAARIVQPAYTTAQGAAILALQSAGIQQIPQF